MQTKNPKEYWKYIKSLDKSKNASYPPLDSLYEHFRNINKSNEPHENFETQDGAENEILNKHISAEEICKCIKNLKNGKCPGEDQILNEYIKSTQHIFLPIYVKLFNTVFDSGIIPSAWLEGIIRPIYKNKGDIKNVENFRPITILSCLGKLFTSMLNNRLTEFVDKNNELSENQAGFRKGYGTTDHIFVLNSLIEIMKKTKQKLFCAFIDFSQAFDSIWRGGLWRKLIFKSVNGKFFKIVYNMYENIKSCVRINNETSAFFPSECGVRQGENLSPLLFSMYLDDLENFIISGGVDSINLEIRTNEIHVYLKLLILLYADDTIIFSNNKTNFQKALDNFHEYCTIWKLKVNLSKTNVVIFNSRTNRNMTFTLGGQILSIKDKYKYLGVIFSKSGSFLNAKKHIVEQAKKAMHLLFIRSNNLDLPIDLQIKLFDNTIVPILTYGCEVFGYENLGILEGVHLEFLRKLGRLRKSTPKFMIYAEFGRYPLYITIKQRMLNFWIRILNGKASKFSYQLYLYMYAAASNDNEHGFKWIHHIRSILNESGRPDLWLKQFDHIPFSSSKIIKQTLIDQFIQNWNGLLQNSSKGKNYALFKDNTSQEKYLTILNGNLAKIMLKFRTGNHKLPVEVGRWHNIELTDRKCQLCHSSSIGDEFHYILECSFFKTERQSLVSQYFYKRPNILKFKQLFSMENRLKLTRLAKFMKIIMSHFK